MIQYRNVDNWKLINYQGHYIKEVHSSLGKVWPTIPPTPKFYAEYSDSTTYSAGCDSDSTLTTATTKPSGYQYTAMTDAIIGDCITSIGYSAFQGCSSLTSITIPNSVTDIGHWTFSYCSSLTSIVIPSGVTSIGNGVFHSCTNLSSITIPNSVTDIGGSVFPYCESLTSVTIPSGVTNIGQEAFSMCERLQSITVDAIVPPALGFAALMGTNNCPIYVPCQSVDAYKAASVWSNYASRITCIQPPTPTGAKFYAEYNDSTTYSAECDSSTTLTIGTTQAHSTSHYKMTNAVVGDCITTIGWNAFNGCSGLTSVTIPSSVTVISGSAFIQCSSLPSIALPSGITSISDSTFYNCTSLSSITIPSGVTSVENYAFFNCKSLTSVTVESLTPPTLSNNAFQADTNLAAIYVPQASVSAYQTAWSTFASIIQAIP